MACLKGFLITIALFIAAQAEDSVDDSASLLQAGMHEKASLADGVAVEDAPSVSCESFKKGYEAGIHEDEASACAAPAADAVTKAFVKATLALEKTAATASSMQEDPPVAASPVQQDPPGAATFKAVLQLMIVIIFVDGLRRWRRQQNEAARQTNVAEASKDDAVDRAWKELLEAVSRNDELSFKKIDLKKSFVKREDTFGCTALHFAANGGSTVIATDLLQLGAEVDAVDVCNETPLHCAARAGHVSMCDLLLSNGAAIDALNEQDMTPLVVAGHAKQEATCRLLVDRGGTAGGMADQDLPLVVVGQVMRKVLEGI